MFAEAPVDFASGSRRTLSFLGISNASCQLHHLAILFRTIADLGRVMTNWGITLTLLNAFGQQRCDPNTWSVNEGNNFKKHGLLHYPWLCSNAFWDWVVASKDVWSCKRFGQKTYIHVPIINKHSVLGKKVAIIQKLILESNNGLLKLDFWLLRLLTPHHFGTAKPYISIAKGQIRFFTASHSSNPTKLKIEKQIGPFLGIPAGVASNASPMPNRADITSFLGRIPTEIRGIELLPALNICCYLASWCFQTQLKNIIQIGSFPPGSRWKQKNIC